MDLSKKQQQVYEWMKDVLKLSVFAEAYKGAAILISQRSAGYVSFVAHAGRDLMNSFASTVAGGKSEQVQYHQHIDNLQRVWQDEWRISDEFMPEKAKEGYLIPIHVCQKISTLIDEHKSGRKRSADADALFFSRFLDYSDKDKIPNNFYKEWKAAKKWFLGHAHLREKPFCDETHSDLVKHFSCLDSYLYIAASSQYDRLKDIDEILDATNQ